MTDKTSNPCERTTHLDAQWFPEAGLGLFIHWGISSVHGNIDLSWGMIKHKPWDPMDRTVSPSEYYALAERFDPQEYDPEQWLGAAKEAGFRYAVLTTKHHDGYALWPSEHVNIGVKQYLDGRDLVRQYVEACRKVGLRVGFYFSPRDWHYPGFLMPYPKHDYDLADQAVVPDKAENQVEFERFYAYTVAQLKELLTWYGKIDILWFDGIGWPGEYEPHAAELLGMVRELQPGIVINDRWTPDSGGERPGDFETPECHLPSGRPAGWWETCQIWPFGSWGYDTHHEQYKSLGWMLSQLSVSRGWGGNLLINVSPRPTGEMPEAYYIRMAELRGWMAHSGEAMFGVQPGPYPEQCNVPVTTRDGRWYLLCPRDNEGQLTLKSVEKPKRIALLRTGQELVYEYAHSNLRLVIPPEWRSCDLDVVTVDW